MPCARVGRTILALEGVGEVDAIMEPIHPEQLPRCVAAMLSCAVMNTVHRKCLFLDAKY
jgi:hypothetical protein